MSEKQIVVLLCDLPHKREVRAVDTLTVTSALGGGPQWSVDVCGPHLELLSSGTRTRTRRQIDGDAEELDKMPTGWTDTKGAAKVLGLSASRVLKMRRDGDLPTRSVVIPGHRGAQYIFERKALK